MRWRTLGAATALALGVGAFTGHAQTKISGEELAMFPASIAMGTRSQRVASVATRSGKVPPRVDWAISNPGVASIAPHGSSVDIKALSPGRALVTARLNGRSATASITVADEADLRLGTTRWSVPPIAGLVPRPLLDAFRVDDDGAELFAIDADPMKRFAVVRALTSSGTLVWQRTVRGTPWAGDRFGGLLVRLGALDEPSRGLARIDRLRGKAAAWRYRARGDLEDFAEADDGTIFLVEQTRPRLAGSQSGGTQVVALDGRTGLDVGHYALPVSTWQTSGTCVPKAALVRHPSQVGSLGEGADGAVYAQLLLVHDSWTRVCEKGRPVLGRGRFRASRELQLVRLTRKGFTPVRTLWRADTEGVDSADRLRAIEDVDPGPIVELKSGELVAMRTHVTVDAGGRVSGRLHIARIARGEVVREVVRAENLGSTSKGWRVLVDAPDSPWAYVADGVSLQAIDLGAGTTVWSLDTAALPFQALDGRAVVANDAARNQVMEINQRGMVLRTFPARIDDARIAAPGQAVIHGIDPQTRSVVEVQEPGYVDSAWSSMVDIDTSFPEARRRFADFLVETR